MSTDYTAVYNYCHPPKGDSQTLVYTVWSNKSSALSWITVNRDWLRETASLNDLKNLAIQQLKEILR